MSDEFKSVKEFNNLYQFENKGDELIGNYLGSYKHTSKNKKNADGTPKVFNVHKIDRTNSDGTGHVETQFFGAGQLDSLLVKVEVGKRIKVVYLGMEEVDLPQFGKTDVHQFDVLVAQ